MAKQKTKDGAKKAGGGRALERSPSHLLHRALQLALDIYGEETGADALTQRQYAVLAAVAAHEGLTQTDLVHATGIDRSTLADLVARMIGKSLIARERSTADARANTVRLTDLGRSALADTGPRVAAADARILELLPARKRDLFLNVLYDMGRASESKAAEEDAAPKSKKKKKAKDKAAKAEKPPKAEKSPKAAKPSKAAKISKSSGPAKPAKADAAGGKKKKAKKADQMAETAS
jgi:DNA-binding MarR family transcriptional regulator